MAHSLYHIRSKLTNTPHLIEQSSFESIMDYINKRCEGGVDVEPSMSVEDEYSMSQGLFNPDTLTGVLSVDGPLSYRTTMWQALCGGTSYELLKEQMESYVERGAKTVAMLVNSGGGEAHQMMATADYLRKLADDNGIKLLAYVDGMSCSAAYGLSAVADEIIMSEDSQVGSIGVLIQLMNDSKALEKEGYERTFITAGASKIPFTEDGSFRKEFLQDLQSKVDVLYEKFTSHVATHRQLSVDVVKGTEAKVFLAEEAISLGLADSVMTVEGFYGYLADVAQSAINERGDTMSNPLNRMFKFSKEDKQEMMKLEEVQGQLEAAHAELAQVVLAKEELAGLLAAQAELVAGKEAELVAALSQVAELKEQEATNKVSLRKKELSAVLAADKVEATLQSLASLDDAAFSTIVGSFAAAKAVIESSDLMTEVGADVEQEDEVVEDKAQAITKARLAQLCK